jgi:hypothetical protein
VILEFEIFLSVDHPRADVQGLEDEVLTLTVSSTSFEITDKPTATALSCCPFPCKEGFLGLWCSRGHRHTCLKSLNYDETALLAHNTFGGNRRTSYRSCTEVLRPRT